MCCAPALPHCGSWRVVEDADPSVDVGRNPLGLARAWRGSASRHRKKPAKRAGVIHPRSRPANAGDRGLTVEILGCAMSEATGGGVADLGCSTRRHSAGQARRRGRAQCRGDNGRRSSTAQSLPPTTKFCHPLLGSLFWTVRGVRPNNPQTSKRSPVRLLPVWPSTRIANAIAECTAGFVGDGPGESG